MESILTIPGHPPNPCDPYSTKGDEPRTGAPQYLLRTSTESNDPRMSPTESKALLYHNLDSLSNDIGLDWDNEDPAYPFRFLDLPLEIQLEVVEILSESHKRYDLDISLHCQRHPLLDLRQ